MWAGHSTTDIQPAVSKPTRGCVTLFRQPRRILQCRTLGCIGKKWLVRDQSKPVGALSPLSPANCFSDLNDSVLKRLFLVRSKPSTSAGEHWVTDGYCHRVGRRTLEWK